MNYTKNYQLPQWVETDRILMGDFNQAMADIDTGMAKAQSTVNGAQSTADGAQSAAAAAQSAANSANTAATKAQAAADAAQTTADNAVSAAAAAQSTADAAAATAAAKAKLVTGSLTVSAGSNEMYYDLDPKLGLFWTKTSTAGVASPGGWQGRFFLGDWETVCTITMFYASVRLDVPDSAANTTVYYALFY